jgi:hypothetical protein
MSTPTLPELKQQILFLSEEDRRALIEFLVAQAEADSKKEKHAGRANFSGEMEWIRRNRESYRGEFVALKEGGELVAHGASERDVWHNATLVGVDNPFLAYIETEAEETFGGW